MHYYLRVSSWRDYEARHSRSSGRPMVTWYMGVVHNTVREISGLAE